MTMTRYLAAGCFALLLGGCSMLPKSLEINPPRMHVAADGEKPSADGSVQNAADAEVLPTRRYYAALAQARQATGGPAQQAAVDHYVNVGVTLVNSYCLRWFQNLSEQDMARSFADGNINVIRELGTALLGLAKANTYFVTSYGATNTAYAGLAKNYNDSFLLAPNSRKVKDQVFNLLGTRERELLDTQKPRNFDEAYRKLERYADLCTHSTAKEIVNSALDQSNATITPDGKIQLEASSNALKKANESATEDKLKAEAAAKAAKEANRPLEESLRAAQAQLDHQTQMTNKLLEETKALRQAAAENQRRAEKAEEQLRSQPAPASN